jgi:hypothetical protein
MIAHSTFLIDILLCEPEDSLRRVLAYHVARRNSQRFDATRKLHLQAAPYLLMRTARQSLAYRKLVVTAKQLAKAGVQEEPKWLQALERYMRTSCK